MSPLREIALLFIRLGCTAFGGPAAHIAMMEDEVVRRRQWMTREEFLDLLGATNLIPGPNSTEMAIHIGHRRGGWPGLLVAGSCFILPAAFITLGFAWAYVKFGTLPQAKAVLYGVKPVIIAVVLQALWGLGRSALKTSRLMVIGVLALGAAVLNVNELLILLVAGVLAIASGPRVPLMAFVPVAPLGSVFLFFAKVGSVLYGSGYVLLAFLEADLVDRWHWLTKAQLLDAVAVGQFTPGPVFTTATFVGYLLHGVPGALVATLGIFLPAFAFVALSGPLVPRLRRSRVASAFLDGVNVASLALMANVAGSLARAALVDGPAVVLAVASAVLLLRWRVNSAWLVLGGAAIGMCVYR